MKVKSGLHLNLLIHHFILNHLLKWFIDFLNFISICFLRLFLPCEHSELFLLLKLIGHHSHCHKREVFQFVPHFLQSPDSLNLITDHILLKILFGSNSLHLLWISKQKIAYMPMLFGFDSYFSTVVTYSTFTCELEVTKMSSN